MRAKLQAKTHVARKCSHAKTRAHTQTPKHSDVHMNVNVCTLAEHAAPLVYNDGERLFRLSATGATRLSWVFRRQRQACRKSSECVRVFARRERQG